jgi:hypothetical protein
VNRTSTTWPRAVKNEPGTELTALERAENVVAAWEALEGEQMRECPAFTLIKIIAEGTGKGVT